MKRYRAGGTRPWVRLRGRRAFVYLATVAALVLGVALVGAPTAQANTYTHYIGSYDTIGDPLAGVSRLA